MNFLKVVGIALLFLMLTPTIVNTVASFYSLECELLCCEQAEEEKEENNTKKEIDDIEECLLSQNNFLYSLNNSICSYSFHGKHFIDIVSDIITPPPEA